MPKTPNPLTLTDTGPRIAAAYIRCSTANQEDSPAVQRAIIEEYAQRQGYAIPPDLWFVDEGVSGGKPMHKRAAGGKMLTQATDRKRRTFETIIIVRPDRAFRDHADQETAIGLILKAGCEIEAVKADMGTATAMQRTMLRVSAVFAQAERELAGERIKEHNADRHRNRLHTHGRPAFGLRVANDSNAPLEIVPEELPRVIRLFEVYAATCGNSRETARLLNAEHVKPRQVLQWTPQRVRATVRLAQYRRMEVYDHDLREKPLTIPETVPADLIERVNAILTTQYGHWHKDRGQPAPGRVRGVYSGLLRCFYCGSPLDTNNRANQGESPNFTCRKSYNGADSCAYGAVHGPTLDEMVGEAIHARLTIITADRQGDIAPPAQRLVKAAPDRESRIAALQQKRAIALDMRLSEQITADEWNRIAGEVAAGVMSLMQEEQETAPRLIMSAGTATELLSRWSDVWDGDLYAPEKREILTVYLGIARGGIVVKKEKFQPRVKTKGRITLAIHVPLFGDEPLTIERTRSRGHFRVSRATG